jgi:hypothetical protein
MTTLAADMGVARRSAVTVLADLVRGGEGFPFVMSREVGRKVRGHRRESNTYHVAIRPGWALDAYLNREAAALGHVDHQPIGDPAAPTIGHVDHYVGDPVAQVLPSDLPITSAQGESTPSRAGSSKKTILPDDFAAGPDAIAIAAQRGLDLALELQKLRWDAKAKGTTSHDWQATLCKWLAGAREPERPKFGQRRAQPGQHSWAEHIPAENRAALRGYSSRGEPQADIENPGPPAKVYRS